MSLEVHIITNVLNRRNTFSHQSNQIYFQNEENIQLSNITPTDYRRLRLSATPIISDSDYQTFSVLTDS